MKVNSISYYEFENFRLDVKKKQLLKNGDVVSLNHKGFQILLLLVQNYGEILKKETIVSEIWSDSFVEDSNLTQHIYVLRKILAQDQKDKIFIETVPKRGYIFTADVRLIYEDEGASKPENSFQNAFEEEDLFFFNEEIKNDSAFPVNNVVSELEKFNLNQKKASKGKTGKMRIFQSRFVRAAILTLAASLLVIIGGLIYNRARNAPISPQPPPVAARRFKSIAVLPFKPIGEESNNEKLGFGMADAVITRLTKLQTIPVRSTSAIFKYTEQPADIAQIGLDLNVDAVLEGTIQRERDRVRVNVQLIEVGSNKPLWAENFDERFTDLFAVQDAISAKVVRSLETSFAPRENQSDKLYKTPNFDAYQSYLLGLYFYNKRSKEALEKAEQYLLSAVRLDPGYAQAHAVLADVYNMQVYYKFAENDSKERREKAKREAEIALGLDETLPQAHIAMAQVLASEPSDSEAYRQHLERAVELAPYDSNAHLRYGWALLAINKPEDAERQIRTAQENDPVSAISNGAACDILLLNRNFSEGLKFCEKSFELDPNLPQARQRVANAFFKIGDTNKAVGLIKQDIAQNDNNLFSTSLLAYYLARAGNTVESQSLLSKLLRQADRAPMMAVNFALTYQILGEKQESIKWLQRAFRTNQSLLLFFRYDANFDAFKTDPYYKEHLSEYMN